MLDSKLPSCYYRRMNTNGAGDWRTLSLEGYRGLLLAMGYGAEHAADQLEYLAESASARRTVYAAAVRKGLIGKAA